MIFMGDLSCPFGKFLGPIEVGAIELIEIVIDEPDAVAIIKFLGMTNQWSQHQKS